MAVFDSRYFSLEDYDGEIWKPICDGYAVSNMGRVKSLHRTIIRCDLVPRTLRTCILSPSIGTNGYLGVNLGKRKSKEIHRLVAEAFCERLDGNLEVDHIDKNKLNNKADNLRWISHLENVRHSTLGKYKDNTMEHNPRAKAVIGFKDGCVVEEFDCAKKITLKYGVNYSTLRKGLQRDNFIFNGIRYYYKNNAHTS